MSADYSLEVIRRLLPSLSQRTFVDINFDLVIAAKRRANPSFDHRDPMNQERLFREEAQSRGGEYAFGGWMEHRGNMFDTCYMAADRRFIHLGVDISAPVDTPVYFPLPTSVLRVVTSPDTEVGWGTRVDLADDRSHFVYLLGHLAPDVSVSAGERVSPNQRIGSLGDPTVNGGTDPHLHIQVMSRSLYEKTAEEDLDGYGRERDSAQLRLHYPDPIKALAEDLNLL